MIELAKHIEVLLLENDCVIVPGLGGFIAHYRSSVFNEDTGEFCPPARTIGFNPQLVMNDGLLVQSYMQAYNTDFPDATRRIEKIVSQLKEDIYRQGHIHLNNVGTLYYNMNGVYEFEPEANGFFTPSL
ncbi:MAG: SPOR domain-containing protein, partial [Parabacteroides sp.]|nr:SPOR domain-containing protein [Parabacteroides sp.]